MSDQGYRGDVFVAVADADRVLAGVQDGAHAQLGRGAGVGDQVDDDLVAGQRPPSPVQGDLGEQPVLDLVPLAGAGRKVGDGDRQCGVGGEGGEFDLPGPDPGSVGATTVGADQQPAGARVAGASDGFPPGAQGRNRERGGVVVGPDADPAGVGGHVIDAVGDGLAELLIREVMDVDLLGGCLLYTSDAA